MIIHSMTATFGKLEHDTLTLRPGLNVIEAPNEWGKSTWCAFLVAMLYGIETRVHSTKTALADKERYAPWSGSPMAGRIDLNWDGRNITIERRTKGRSIFGEFKAYETDSGLPVPELTAANCGQMLLGVERSVFTRSGFLRLTDLPVTQDESLRRRLNALVTTGDESGAADALAQKLRDLKNRCRFNRSGLLPQAEAQREELSRTLQELESLETQIRQLQSRLSDLEAHTAKLTNHQTALQYQQSQADARRVALAAEAADNAKRHADDSARTCSLLPGRENARQMMHSLRALQQQLSSLQMETRMLPQMPSQVQPPAPFAGLTPAEALARAQADTQAHSELTKVKPRKLIFLPFLLAAILAGVGGWLLYPEITGIMLFALAIAALTAGITVSVVSSRRFRRSQAQARALEQHYAPMPAADWINAARNYSLQQQEYDRAMAHYHAARGDLDRRTAELQQQITEKAQGVPLDQAIAYWTQVDDAWDAHDQAQRESRQAQAHADTLRAMAKPAQPPHFPDELTFSPAETARLLSDAAYEQRQLQLRLGQAMGRMEQLGQKDTLQQQLNGINTRIARLEDAYAALTLAQATLSAATAELQRRFAPRIAMRAQALFSDLTGGRYDRLTLGEDLSLQAGAKSEDTLRSSLWRSDGTVDQLYLALRLAVAAELTPEAPLILDDAFVRFDDGRLASAMAILQEEAKQKQVILFTCQSRESAYTDTKTEVTQ